jgi:hypothetical protein
MNPMFRPTHDLPVHPDVAGRRTSEGDTPAIAEALRKGPADFPGPEGGHESGGRVERKGLPSATAPGLKLLVLSIPILAVLTLILNVGPWIRARGPGERLYRAGHPVGPAPLRVGPTMSFAQDLSQSQRSLVLNKLMGSDDKSLGFLLHRLKVLGNPATIFFDRSIAEAYQKIIFDHNTNLAYMGGQASLRRSRYGVRCRSTANADGAAVSQRQAHTDLLLSICAEIGIPLDCPLSTEEGGGTVRDLLDDALANFDVKQREIEWSVAAFALYLAPYRGWLDRYDRPHTFDEAARELIASRIAPNSPCGGLHKFITLTYLMRIDASEKILSPGVRSDLHEYMEYAVRCMASAQNPEGSWSVGWYEPFNMGTSALSRSNIAGEMLATGHILEWILLLPEPSRPRRELVLKAIEWTRKAVLESSQGLVEDQYCPFVHSVYALSVTGPL